MRDWLDMLLATIGTGVVVGAAVALLAGLFGHPSTFVVGVVSGVVAAVATLFVAGAVVSLRTRQVGRRASGYEGVAPLVASWPHARVAPGCWTFDA